MTKRQHSRLTWEFEWLKVDWEYETSSEVIRAVVNDKISLLNMEMVVLEKELDRLKTYLPLMRGEQLLFENAKVGLTVMDSDGDIGKIIKIPVTVKRANVEISGKLIRKISVDEIPQLLNVLLGDMSLVGPRPPLPYEVEVYQEWHKRRFEVLPGITGFWQVKARNRVSFDEMIKLDLEYIERQSFWHDLIIILQTPWALISGRGAG